MKEKQVIINQIEYKQALTKDLIRGAYHLMVQEFQTNGGNLKDKSSQELDQLLSTRGQLWVAHLNSQVVATHTIEAVAGSDGLWLYINNGVVAPQYRYQSSGIMDQLLSSSMQDQPLSNRYFVISVVWGLFARLGFRQVSLEEISQIDQSIAQIIENKLRKDKKVFIGIKEGVFI